MRSTSVLLALVALVPVSVLAQTAAPFPEVVYTYQGSDAPSSLLEQISTAGEPARSINAQSAGEDTATAVVAPFPTTATIGPNTVPPVTTGIGFSSGQPGEILSTATRAPFLTTGTIDTSTAAASSTSSPVSAASRQGSNSAWVLSVAVGAMGLVAGGMLTM